MGVGPSTKETTLHHFKDPLLDVFSGDPEIDLLGVVVVGSPQSNEEKNLVGKRAAAWIEGMRADGVVFSVDSWGNSHVDYENTFREIGCRGIPTVGLSFIGTQAQFVVDNEYMDTIVDINKSELGIETEVVGENNLVNLDARKALAMLKLKMRKGK